MEKQASKPLSDLTVDVLDFMFFEWLVRHSLYLKFVANLSRFHPDSKNPIATGRGLIKAIPSLPAFTASDLLSISFPSRVTPEGSRFWARASREWSSYLKSFSEIL